MIDEQIKALILRRRRQMCVHSCIYYRMGTSLISDGQFDTWGHELMRLQNDYPDLAKSTPLAEDFKDWDASTGFNLPRGGWVEQAALSLVNHAKKERIK